MGSKGIDLPRISQKLDAISSKRTLEAIEPVDEFDLDSLLENELRNCILGVIESEHKLVSVENIIFKYLYKMLVKNEL